MNLAPEGQPSLRRELGDIPGRVERYPLSSLVVGRQLRLRRGRELEADRRELQRVLPLRAGPPRARPAGARLRRRWPGPRLGGTASRTARAPGRSPPPGPPTGRGSPTSTPTSASGTRASSSIRTCCCRCPPTTSPRSGSRPVAVDRTRVDVRPAVRPRRGRPARLRPVGRRGLLGRRQPAGLGDLRVRAARHELACLPAGVVRADGGRLPRHPALAAAAPGSLEGTADDRDVRRTPSSASAPSAARPRGSWLAVARRVVGLEQFELGHERGASHDTSRIIRHSYHTPDYVDLTFEAYDDWATLEADAGESFVTVTGGLDLFPPGCAIPPDDYTSSLDALARVPYERARLPSRSAVAGRARRCREGTVAVHQARTGIVPAARGTAAMQRQATARRAPCCATSHPVDGGARPRLDGARGRGRRRDLPRAPAWSSPPTPGPTTCSGTSAPRSR